MNRIEQIQELIALNNKRGNFHNWELMTEYSHYTDQELVVEKQFLERDLARLKE